MAVVSKKQKQKTSRDGGQKLQNGPDENAKKRGIGGLFKKRKPEAAVLPAIDLDASLNRAMRAPKGARKSGEVRLRDSQAVRDALTAIEGALYALDQADEILEQCLEVIKSAKHSEEVGARALLAESYDELRLGLDGVNAEAGDGVSLIGEAAENLDIEMTGHARYAIAAFRLDSSPKGLNLPPPLEAFADMAEVDQTLAQLTRAQTRLERATAGYCRDAKFLMARLQSMISPPSADARQAS